MLGNHCSYSGKTQDKEADLDSSPGSDIAHLWALRQQQKSSILALGVFR